MKNIGLTIAITVAILALLAGGYFMWKKESTEPITEANTMEDMNYETNEDAGMEITDSPTPTESNTETTSNLDIDAELKNLDTDMSSAFQKDSDSDPTTEIE